MKIFKLIMILALIISLNACSEFLNINDDPIAVNESQLELLLPGIQASTALSANDEMSRHASIFVQQIYSLGVSRYSIMAASFDKPWREMYAGGLQDLEDFITTAEIDSLPVYAGIGKVMKAYNYSMMVDLWNDIPYDNALQGIDNLNPEPTSGSDIYNSLQSLLDEAIEDLSTTNTTAPASDLIYDGNADQWIAAANTLKLKLYLQIRLIDESAARDGISALLNEDAPLIIDYEDDYQFTYGTNQEPENRHFLYVSDYNNSKINYMSNYFMDLLLYEPGNENTIDIVDPRLRYYVYRQTLDDPEGNDVPCANVNDCPIGYVGDGYIGRDHGDPSGLPADDAIRSVFGLYPVGGQFDDGRGETISVSDGSGGDGIMPYLTSSMTYFLLAEAALELGTAGEVDSLFEKGMEQSFAKIRNFGLDRQGNVIEAWESEAEYDYSEAEEEYIEEKLTQFSLGNDTDKLRLIMEQAYIAYFGNGIEAYNNYRRTGFPVLPASIAPLGPFPLRYPYPPFEINSNANINQVLLDVPVFWDVN